MNWKVLGPARVAGGHSQGGGMRNARTPWLRPAVNRARFVVTAILFLTLAPVVSAAPCAAREDVPLEAGTGAIVAGETRTFSVPMRVGDFMRATISPDGPEVAVELTGADGAPLARVGPGGIEAVPVSV